MAYIRRILKNPWLWLMCFAGSRVFRGESWVDVYENDHHGVIGVTFTSSEAYLDYLQNWQERGEKSLQNRAYSKNLEAP